MTLQKKLTNVGSYRLTGKKLGKGNFAKVEEALHTILNVKVAIKIMDTDEIKEEYIIKNIHREARIMYQLNHPCIAALFQTMQNGNIYYLVTELIGGGDLCTFIKSLKCGKLEECNTRMYARQLISAVAHMHTLGIVHRDLKMENVMMNSIRTQIKIVDFGLSNLYDPNNPLRTHCGSPEYAAPELFVPGKCYGSEVDLWSLGVILYGMVVGQLPFVTVREENMTSKERRRKLLVQINKGYTATHRKNLWFASTDFRTLISKMLVTDSLKRISLSELIFHSWVTDKGRKAIVINPLKRLDENWQTSIMKQVGTLLDLDWTTVKYSIVTDPHGDLAGMYNILAYKLQTQQLQGDVVTKNVSHAVHNLNINNAIIQSPKKAMNKKYAEIVKSVVASKIPPTISEPRATTAKPALDTRPPKIKKESREPTPITKFSEAIKSVADKIPKILPDPKTSRGHPIKRIVPISKRPLTTPSTMPSKCVKSNQQIDSHVLELNLDSRGSDYHKSNTSSKDQSITPPCEGFQLPNSLRARTISSAGQESTSSPIQQLRLTQKSYTPRVRNFESMKNEVCVVGSRGLAHALQCKKTVLKTSPSPRVTRSVAMHNIIETTKSKSEPPNNGRRSFTAPVNPLLRPLKRNRVIPVMGSPSAPSKGSSDSSALQVRSRRVMAKPPRNSVEVSPYALGDAYKRRSTTTPAKHAVGPRSILADPIARSIAGYIANNIPDKADTLYRYSQNGKKGKPNKLSASPANVKI